MHLVKYEEARAALKLCASVDEAKSILDKVDALRAYAKQQDEPEMEIWLAEMKLRARRRIGEISAGLETSKGERTDIGPLPSAGKRSKTETLKQAGITTSVANRCEKVAAIPGEKFEAVIAKARDEHKPITYAEVEKSVNKQKKQDTREKVISDQVEEIAASPLPPIEKRYHVISIDPPWPYETGKANSYDPDGRRVSNPYPEMSIQEIGDLQIPAHEDSVLWLWTTHRFLPDSFKLLEQWGFDYKATMVWNKEKIGMGHWLRMQCEFCILAIKGDPVWDNTKVRDILTIPRREHSRKPDEFFDMVDGICKGAKLEYFSREKRDGWDQIGNDPDKF